MRARVSLICVALGFLISGSVSTVCGQDAARQPSTRDADRRKSETPSNLRLQLRDRKRPQLPSGTQAVYDIRYAVAPTATGQVELKLDLYLPPKSDVRGKLPVIVFAHGGGWNQGTKNRTARPFLELTKYGYAVASIDYRMAKEAAFPACIEDMKTAVRFLRASAEKYGLDTARFAAAGSSSAG